MNFKKNILIIAPHPDDEVLGCGGIINKINSIGGNVSILTICNHLPPLYKISDANKTINEMKKIHKFLGVKKSINFKFPACLLYKEAQYKLNNKINAAIKKIMPNYVFLPFPDRHQDHKIVFESAMVSTRPKNDMLFIEGIFAYEVLSETYWNASYIEPNFNPDLFINISKEINKKLQSIKKYKSQITAKDKARSIEAVESLAKFRGSQNGYDYAEAFKIIRLRLD